MVQVHLAFKKSFFLFLFFFSPQLILQKSSGYFQRRLSFAKVPVGVTHFPGGVQLLFPYRNPVISQGGPDPLPPSGSAHVIPRIVV